MSVRRMNALVWFGVVGGAVAWATQFVLGMQLGLARCDSPNARFQIPIDAWAIALAASASVIVLLAELAAIAVFRATRNGGASVARERIHFLATLGLTVNPLVLAITVMGGVGVPVLSLCHQS
jgi:hypothetical protein